MKRACIWLLEDSDLDGVTEAMMDHALARENRGTEDMFATEDYLRKALNKRLNKAFRTMKDLCAYIRDLREPEAQQSEGRRP